LSPKDKRPGASVFLAVGIAVLAVSASAIFIRLADAPALAVAFWRNAMAVAVLLPVALLRREAFPQGRALLLAVAAGLALALHFGLWITSLEHTSVAASVVLVCTQPIFVALLARLFLKEHTSAAGLLGIGVAFFGAALIALDATVFASAPLGNALALGGALMVALYVLLGRRVRSEGVAVLPYAVVVYATACVGLLPTAMYSGAPLWGYDERTWLWLLAIAVGPQILGHTIFNWALRYMKAALLSGTILLEPVVSTLLAWWILAERPGSQTLAGGLVVLGGLALLLRGREGRVARVTAAAAR
jgi:drug/metabolite transporter (DMT)-like permease